MVYFQLIFKRTDNDINWLILMSKRDISLPLSEGG